MNISPYVIPGIIPADLSPEAIIGIVAGEFDLTLSQILKKGKEHKFSTARQTAMFFIKKVHPKMTHVAICQLVGRADHTTCNHAIKTVQCLIDTKDPYLYPVYLKIKSKINIK